MPIPLIIGAAALIAGAAGIGLGARGYVKMSEAKDSLEAAKARNEDNIKRLNDTHQQACESTQKLGQKGIEILVSFKEFLEEFEKIKHRPSMEDINLGDVKVPEFNHQELKQVNQEAIVVNRVMSGPSFGMGGGFTAAGATTAALLGLGTASTSAAISSLSGVAATNATLSALGGTSFAAGSSGIALGSMVLGASSLGVGALVGGIFLNYEASSLEEKADKAWSVVEKNEQQINKICDYLKKLDSIASTYYYAIKDVNALYEQQFDRMRRVMKAHSDDYCWSKFNHDERVIVDNTVLVVTILLNMSTVKLVKQSQDKDGFNQINYADISKYLKQGSDVVKASGDLHRLASK